MSPEELLKTMDGYYHKLNSSPDRAARAVIKGVERNRGVILVCPETYIQDILHRLSRRLFGLFIKAITWYVFERM